MAADRRMAVIVRSTLDLARRLALSSVAKPIPASMLERWVEESPWLTGDVPVTATALIA